MLQIVSAGIWSCKLPRNTVMNNMNTLKVEVFSVSTPVFVIRDVAADTASSPSLAQRQRGGWWLCRHKQTQCIFQPLCSIAKQCNKTANPPHPTLHHPIPPPSCLIKHLVLFIYFFKTGYLYHPEVCLKMLLLMRLKEECTHSAEDKEIVPPGLQI